MTTAEANSNERKSTWEEVGLAVQGRWGQLTREDLENLRKKAVRLAELVHERYGVSLDDAKKQVIEFEAGLEERVRSAYQSASNEIGARVNGMRRNMEDFNADVRDFGLGTTLVDLARHYPLIAMGTAFTLGFLLNAAIKPAPRRRW